MNVVAIATLVTWSLGSAASAAWSSEEEHWPRFLGPAGNNVSEGTPSTLRFDKERDVLWRVPLPGGSSSPCIWGSRLFLTASDGEELQLLAFDRSSGEELWSHTLKRGDTGRVIHIDAVPAASTPCTNGAQVFFYFGGWGMVATDLDGERLWAKDMPIPRAPYGVGTSPVCVDDLVVLNRDGCHDSGIYAFEAATGEQRWYVPRIGFLHGFGTPYLWDNHLRRELIVGGTQRLTSLDPATGREHWLVPNLTTFVCTSPVGDDDHLYFAAWSTREAGSAERATISFGVEFQQEELSDLEAMYRRLDKDGDGKVTRLDITPSRAADAWPVVDPDDDGVMTVEEFRGSVNLPQGKGKNLGIAVEAGGEGDVSGTHVVWTLRRGLPYVASPLLFDERLYLVKAGGIFTCVEAATGEKLYDIRLSDHSEYYATPLAVKDHVIVCASGGTLYVMKAGDEPEVVHTVDLGERLFASPALVDGTFYLRSEQALYAFGRQKSR